MLFSRDSSRCSRQDAEEHVSSIQLSNEVVTSAAFYFFFSIDRYYFLASGSFKEVRKVLKLSSEKLQTLGWKYRPLEESLVDAVENYRELGVLSRNATTTNKNESE